MKCHHTFNSLSKSFLLSLGASLCGIMSATAQFNAGDLVLIRLGDGTQTLGNNGNTVFLEEYNTSGGLVGSPLQIPDSGASSLIMSGSATSEGSLNLSANGQYLVFSGYNTTRPSASSIVGATSATVPRVIGTVDVNRNFSIGASTTSQYSANNIRSGASDGANNFWGAGANSGTYYFGNNAPGATVQSTVANTRVVQDIGGNLYFASSSGTFLGVSRISGTPTTGPNTPVLLLNGGTGSSAYDFAFNPSMTIAYVADDRNTASGGIQRFDFNGTSWNLTYTLGTGAANTGARGLAVDFSGANPIIYATTSESAANRLISVTDTGAGSLASTLATAPTGEIFRGLDFAPMAVPEPGAIALLGVGIAMVFARRRSSR